MTLSDAIAKLQALKDEHRPIVEQVAADPGMSPETRLQLLRHLNEEEEEWIAKAQALLGTATTSSPGLTVGSLRKES